MKDLCSAMHPVNWMEIFINNVTSMQQAVLIVLLEPEETTRNTGYHGDY